MKAGQIVYHRDEAVLCADIDVVAFGAPRPMHRHWVRHCRNIRADFRLFTDNFQEWEQLLDEMDATRNMTLQKVSIDEYFTRAADALGLGGLENFVAICGPRMHNRLNGWTACAFKPLLPVMFPRPSARSFYGWMDWDVFLTNRLLDRLMQWAPRCTDPSLFTPRGIRWEQFKLFPRTAMEEITQEFREGVVGGGYEREDPFDVQFVYDERRVAHGQFCPVAQNDLAVHWAYLETIGPESDANKLDVTVTPDVARLHATKSGREILMFIADREIKTMSEEQVRAKLSADGRELSLPYEDSNQPEAAPAAGSVTGGRQRIASTQKHHCIVTPDLIGPIKNGGIGTACHHLARFLRAERGHLVTILFTGTVDVGTEDQWKQHYASEYGISLYVLQDLPEFDEVPLHNVFWFHLRSFRVDRWLRTQRFDAIHFQDWHANGFVPVQAKTQGLAYGETLLTCTVHSPQEWIDEGARRFPGGGVADMLQRHNERYASCQADLTVFPSRHMLEWAAAHSWKFRRAEIAPYLWTGESLPPPSGMRQPVTEFCFFGRWETRKGVEIFTAALERLRGQLGGRPLPLVSFLGKPGQTADGPAHAHLKTAAAKLGLDFNLIDDLDSSSALDYMASRPGCVAVMPSLCDNLPYAVIECLQSRIPLLASTGGGIPELVSSPEHLFDPEPASLAQSLAHAIAVGVAPTKGAYSPEEAAHRWQCLAEELPPPSSKHRRLEPRDVTVCIAHYNHGDFLPAALDSLARQTASGFHVVVVDDGSNDPHSTRIFEEMRQKWAPQARWRFVRTANAGVGRARNAAVQHSTSPYIVFLDADNIADPRMIEVMVTAMSSSEADCLTCYMEGFSIDAENRRELCYRYLPTGACPEAGTILNIFGDANCIVERSAFLAVGGFSPNRSASFEDWELFARLCLSGRILDVIPEFLHYYRHLESGFSRSTPVYLNHRRVLDAYTAAAPPWVAPILAAFCSPPMPGGAQRSPQLTGLEKCGIPREIARIKASWCWRITAPLRWCGDFRAAFKASRGTDVSGLQGPAESVKYLQDLQTSTSWRLTAPLRRMAGLLGRGRRASTPPAEPTPPSCRATK